MCINCNDSLQVNLPIGPAGINGTNGQSAYVYIASATNNTGVRQTTRQSAAEIREMVIRSQNRIREQGGVPATPELQGPPLPL